MRQRLRVNFANRGKRHAKYVDGKMLTVKYPNDFFLLKLGLVSGAYLCETIKNPKLTPEEFSAQRNKKKKEANKYKKRKNDPSTNRFFQFAYAR